MRILVRVRLRARACVQLNRLCARDTNEDVSAHVSLSCLSAAVNYSRCASPWGLPPHRMCSLIECVLYRCASHWGLPRGVRRAVPAVASKYAFSSLSLSLSLSLPVHRRHFSSEYAHVELKKHQINVVWQWSHLAGRHTVHGQRGKPRTLRARTVGEHTIMRPLNGCWRLLPRAGKASAQKGASGGSTSAACTRACEHKRDCVRAC